MVRSLALGAALVVGMVAPAFAQSADSVVGNYSYTGTDTDGSKYSEAGKVVVKKAPSGALEVSWDDGAYVGVGQVTGNVFAVASVADGKNSIMLLTIGADGSLSGPWWRRLDKGAKGTEVWTKK
ncbi:hypothetical protein HL658_16805 [Azospirillum sp. RWY-5-1]|uniref:Fibronectin-binding protein n=2 Tax=Azospirillum oleiclasticum TaxID=2735135 RepID=A0ABX2TCC6_9PROT|nr:hypothetical protein [Azospirillum oleiclasticum]NYZ21702.1 hypothetical protein [Azospirillum oleiclasticum]